MLLSAIVKFIATMDIRIKHPFQDPVRNSPSWSRSANVGQEPFLVFLDLPERDLLEPVETKNERRSVCSSLNIMDKAGWEGGRIKICVGVGVS